MPTSNAAARYPHLRRPRNRLLRAVWWIGQTGEYQHDPCGERHIPGPCRDGVDRNHPGHARILAVIDYPPLVALWRIAGVAIVAWVAWTVLS